MRLPNGVLAPVLDDLAALAELDIDARPAARICRSVEAVAAALAPVQKQHAAVLRKNGAKAKQNEHGVENLSLDPTDPGYAAAMEELVPLFADEVEVAVYPISLDEDLRGVRVKPKHLARLLALGIVTQAEPDPENG